MSTSPRSLVYDAFRELVSGAFEGDIETTPLAELGVDSLDFFEVAMILEDEHGIVLPPEQLHSELTLKELCDMAEPEAG